MPPRMPPIHETPQSANARRTIILQVGLQVAPIIVTDDPQGWGHTHQSLQIGTNLRKRLRHMKALRSSHNPATKGGTKNASLVVRPHSSSFGGVAISSSSRPGRRSAARPQTWHQPAKNTSKETTLPPPKKRKKRHNHGRRLAALRRWACVRTKGSS